MKLFDALRNRKISDFSKNVLMILTGSSLSQLINVLSIPVLARMFLKEDIGAFQVVLSVIMTISITSSFKYESTIVLPEDESEAKALTALSVVALMVFGILLGFTFFFFTDPLFTMLKITRAKPYAFLVVLTVLVKGFQQIIQQLSLRSKKFKEFSHSVVLENLIGKAGPIVFGLISPTFISLMVFNVIGTIGSISYLLKKVKIRLSRVSLKRIWELAKKYSKFPFVNNPMIFINELSNQLPVFFISKYFNLEIVALFAMGNRIITMPMNIISTSIGRVYYQKAAELYNTDREEFRKLFLKTMLKLILIGFVVIASIYVFSPFIVNLMLGPEWEKSVTYLKITALLIIFRFACNSISSTFTVVDRQEYGLILIVFSIILRSTSMMLFSSTPESMLWALNVSSALFYLFYLIGMYRAILGRIREQQRSLQTGGSNER